MRDGCIAAVMVTHNGQAYVADQLNSMVRQKLPLQRIVIVDDGSTDGTVEVCQKIANDTAIPAIQIIQAPARSSKDSLYTRIAKNFEFGVSFLEDATLVFFADQDDIWKIERTEIQAERQHSTDAGLVVGDASTIDSLGSTLGESLRKHVLSEKEALMSETPSFRELLAVPCVTGATMATTAEFLTVALPIPPGWLHDRWFSLVGAATNMIDISNVAVIEYRLHESQVVGVGKVSESVSVRLWKIWSLFIVLPRRLRKAKRLGRVRSLLPEFYYLAQLIAPSGLLNKVMVRK